MILSESNDYCLSEINESVKGIEVNRKLADSANDSKIKKGCEGIVNFYHKEYLFKYILYLLDNLGYTIQDIENYNKDENII